MRINGILWEVLLAQGLAPLATVSLVLTSVCFPAIVISVGHCTLRVASEQASFGEAMRSETRSKPPPERTTALSVPSEILKHHWSALYSFPCAHPSPSPQGTPNRAPSCTPPAITPTAFKEA